MNPFMQQLQNLGPARLAAMAGVAVGLIAFIIFFATRFSSSIDRFRPMTVVMSQNEIYPKAKIKTVGQI